MRSVVWTSGGAGGPPPVIKLEGYGFQFVASLLPARDRSGGIMEYLPQERYAKAEGVPLHQHGTGPFCRFRITAPKGLTGVYVLMVNGDVRYIGECEDLGKRFNAGYGAISPKNCYKGGQPTNCKINRRVLDVSKAGERVDLYFHAPLQRKLIEVGLIAACSPPWNG